MRGACLLAGNLARWHKSAVELRFVQQALQGDPEITEIPWMSSESHPGRASIANLSAAQPTIHADLEAVRYRPRTTVPATTIDQILADEPLPVPFLKLDLEGADYLALRGAKATLRRHRPLVAFENSGKAPHVFDFTVEEAMGYFESLDYVACNFVGEAMSTGSFFQFHEAWLLPREKMEVLQPLLRGVLECVVASAAK